MLKTTNGFARGAKIVRLLANSAKDNAASNTSLDVRAKQLLCLERRRLNLRLLLAVSTHVISTVRRLRYATIRKLHLAKWRNMFKKFLSLALTVLMLNVVGVSSAYAGSKEEKEARFAARVKESIVKLGTGTDARVEVKLRDKTKLKGYVSQISENSFTVTDEKTGASSEVPYPSAKQVKGNNLSTGVKIAIGVAVVFATLLVISLIAFHP